MIVRRFLQQWHGYWPAVITSVLKVWQVTNVIHMFETFQRTNAVYSCPFTSYGAVSRKIALMLSSSLDQFFGVAQNDRTNRNNMSQVFTIGSLKWWSTQVSNEANLKSWANPSMKKKLSLSFHRLELFISEWNWWNHSLHYLIHCHKHPTEISECTVSVIRHGLPE